MKNSKKNRDQGDGSERYLAARLGMKTQPGSGCGRICKEDLTDNRVLMQAKSTRKDTINIKLEDLQKLRQNAAFIGKEPAFSIVFVPSGFQHQFFDHMIWIAVPLEEWAKNRRR